MSRCVIITAGERGGLTAASLALRPEDWIVCCDGGYLHAKTWGISPDLLVGDFDSYHGPLPSGIPVHRCPVEKDDTDTLLAVKLGVAHGCDEFLLAACTGGRLDHTIANIQTMAWLVEQGKSCVLLGAHERITMVKNGTLFLPRRPGTLSVFSYGPVADGVTLRGVHYPLDNATLHHTGPIGVSNEIVEETAAISVRKGCLLILQCEPDGAMV